MLDVLLKTNCEKYCDVLQDVSNETLEKWIYTLNDLYYNKGKSPLSDKQYDALLEYAESRNVSIDNIGHDISNQKKKVQLPVHMGSMTKIKDSNSLQLWSKKYSSPQEYIISSKLDGLSACYIPYTKKLYTRGNGQVGQDISNLIPFLNIGSLHIPVGYKDLIIRGELIISKENYEKNFKGKTSFSNPRNFVTGLIGTKNPNEIKKQLKYIDFVSYAILNPVLKQGLQFKTLRELELNQKLKCVHFEYISSHLTTELLDTHLSQTKTKDSYEVDGIIICHNENYTNPVSGNPKYAFAYKNEQFTNKKQAIVLSVEWNASKDKYLKPKIHIEQTICDGSKIKCVTGFNAKFILDNKITKGSVLEIGLSGGVIPHIFNVVSSPHVENSDLLLPNDDLWKWSENNVDIILNEETNEVREKKILIFFKYLNIDGLKSGLIHNLVSNGYDSVNSILNMTIDDLIEIDKMGMKKAQTVKSQWLKLKTATLADFMKGSQCFDRGFGDKKINMFVDIIYKHKTLYPPVEEFSKLNGITEKTASQFLKNMSNFVDFMDGLKPYVPSIEELIDNGNVVLDKPQYVGNIVMSGVRSKEIQEWCKKNNYEISEKVNKNTKCLIVSDKTKQTKKMIDALKANINIYLIDEFLNIVNNKTNIKN